VFALLWSVRLFAAGGPWEVLAVVAVVCVWATRRSFANTAGMRARDEFRTPRGKAFLRPVTRATVVQIGASIVLPVVAGMLGFEEWAVPLVALTIGLFLIAFASSLQLDLVKVLGIGASVASIALPFVTDGSTLVAWTSALMAATLTTSVWWCARATV